jgi:hypothetical protein
MPFLSAPSLCWILTVEHACVERWEEFHDGADGDSLCAAVAEVWANEPHKVPPIPELQDRPCVMLICSGCGLPLTTGGDPTQPAHLADEGFALDEAAHAGWLGDVCPACQSAPSRPAGTAHR